MKTLVWPVERQRTAVKARHLEEIRNTSWRLWNERAEKDSAGFVDSKAKETNEWVLNKARVKRELLDTVKSRNLSYYG